MPVIDRFPFKKKKKKRTLGEIDLWDCGGVTTPQRAVVDLQGCRAHD